MLPRVSFVIPALNAERTIRRTIESIHHQTYPKHLIEVIVVDNGSTDLTSTIAQELKVALHTVPVRNRSLARNTGLRNSRGEWIAFIDADVRLEADWLRAMIEKMTHATIAGGQGRIIPVDDTHQKSFEEFRRRLSSWRTHGTFMSLRVVSHNTPMVNTAACLYRRSVLDEVDGLDENLIRHEDVDLSKRISRLGYHFVAVEEACAYVAWQGQGWFDYLVRTFEVGVTKKPFDEKWSRGEFDISRITFFQRKNLEQYKKTNDHFWIQKGFIELLMDLGRFLSKQHYSGDKKIPPLRGLQSLTIFKDRIHAVHLPSNKVFELQLYHGIPLMRHLGVLPEAEADTMMESILGEDFSQDVYREVLQELSEIGLL